MEIFYRKNDKSTNVLLENFFNNNINSLIEEYKSNQIALNLLKENLITFIEDYISKEELPYTVTKEYLKIKRQLKKSKEIKNTLPMKSYACEEYNNRRAKNELLAQEIEDSLEQELHSQIKTLPKLVESKDLLLFRNEYLIKKINEIRNGSQKRLKNKEWISLYHYLSQLTLKTGGVGTVSKVGCFSYNRDQSIQLRNPKNKVVIRIHSYLENRIYYEILRQNIEKFKFRFLVNQNYIISEDTEYYIFKVLLDNNLSNIFRGQERELKIKKISSIDNLLKYKIVSYQELRSLFTKLEVIKLLDSGILLYEDISIGNNFKWMDYIEFTNDSLLNKLLSIKDNLKSLNKRFNINFFLQCSEQIKSLCDLLEIDTLNFPVLTIDTYTSNLKISKNQTELLNIFIENKEQLSKLYSIFDASKKVEELAWEFMGIYYPFGKDFADFQDLDQFLSQMSDYIFKNINLGELRSGFFNLDEYPLINYIINSICESKENEYVISENMIQMIFEKAQEINYNLEHSYTFFTQLSQNQLFINHVYKGYGIFTNRYKDNFEEGVFEEEFGFDKIYDIPYDFGFNANGRPDKESFDIYNLKSQASNSFINYRDIKVERHEVQKRLKFLKKDGSEFYYSFLGSMTPMVLPRTLAMFNSLSLTGGMYFDIADLVLRKKYDENPTLNVYTAPMVYFREKKIVLARDKTLVSTDYLNSLINQAKNKTELIVKLNTLLGGKTFFVREFSVDCNFKNKFEKPIYINLCSSIGIEALKNYIKDLSWIVFEEPNPNFDEDYLTEYIIESNNTVSDKVGSDSDN